MKKILGVLMVLGLMFSFVSSTHAMGADHGQEIAPRTLMIGIRGTDVQVLQQTLIQKGFLVGNADGSFGPKTRLAVMAFQKANNLFQDGKFGAKSRVFLTQNPNTPPQSPAPAQPNHNNPPLVSCAPTDPASITVLSPNGGEVYTSGQNITVTWHSCNGTDPQVTIVLKSTQSLYGAEIATVPDTGTATIALPTALYSGTISLVSGNYYKINLQLGGSVMGGHIAPTDNSDNTFTIN